MTPEKKCEQNISGTAGAAQADAVSERADVSNPARILELLRTAGLRPTRQRMLLAELLFSGVDRHVSAEVLHAEALQKGEHVSLATVYNTLHQFRAAGLVRELAIDATRAYFDTNTSNHNHFFIEQDGELVDIPGHAIKVDGLPTPPEGMQISHIDVVVRLVPIGK
jgi:Fur family transcriptional regulator, iron response regulator